MSTFSLPNSTAGLYNTICDQLNISDNQFQMIQGVLPVQSDASGLYNFVDGIPPQSVATLYTSNPLNGLNGNMQIVINDAKPGFMTTLAEKNYLESKYWVNGNVGVDPMYTPSFSDLMTLVSKGSSATLLFDSATASSDISSAWATSAQSAGVGFWGTSSSSVSSSLNETAASSRITVEIALDKYAYLPVRAAGWFSQGFFTNQYQNPSNWTNGQSDWNNVFGPTGSCQNISNQVLLANGYVITVTSHATYSESDFNQITTSKDTNVWPFYTSSEKSSATQKHSHNQDGSITTTITCNPGSLQIMGMGVVSTKSLMQSGLVSKLI